MNAKTHYSFAGIALLLIGLSLSTAANLTTPFSVRADPSVHYAALTSTGAVARYTFTQFGGTYTPITGGTVHGTGAIDDINYNEVDIGFTFNYNGVDYTQVSINTNGFLRMGSTHFNDQWEDRPISCSDTTCNNLVSALGMDLRGTTNGELRSETIGVTPNRVFVVQWRDFRHYFSFDPDERFNFQIRLYETTNVVEIVYGSFSTDSTSYYPQVGLKGNANNYNNRTGADWAASDRGTTNSATMTLNSRSLPTSGQTYQWTPSATMVFYAAPTAQGNGNCSSWANACTLQTALAQVLSSDEIWVKAGVHYPGPAENRNATFTLQNGVAIYGGFAGTETSRDQRNWQANVTILSGDIDRNDINTDGNFIAETWNDIQGSNAYHVVTGRGTNATAVLDGFVITAGQANGTRWPYNYGGGMYNPDNSSPTLRNITFSGNQASDSGGGMANDFHCSPALTNVAFIGNTATNGGGMYNFDYSNPTLTNVNFSSNVAIRGGGMHNFYVSSPTLINVTFSDNVADYGGGMYNVDHSNPTLTNVNFSSNVAIRGGGMHIYNSSPTLINVTFSGNSATNGGGMDIRFYSDPKLTNVIIWNNTATDRGDSIYHDANSTSDISYSNIQGCGGSGNWNRNCGTDSGNNIDANPLFVDEASGDLHLQTGSPCIDAGNDAAVPPNITTDLDGKPRFSDKVDMGAYEYQHVDLGKALPLNRNTSQPLALTLAWHGKVLADRYEYCYDTINNDACDATWLTTTATSANISNLIPATLYYWQVRAINNAGTTYADGGLWWSFTTAPSAPGVFNKSAPPNRTLRALVAPTLVWSASPGVERYEYCYDTTNDNACSDWISAGTATSVTPSSLLPDTTYYWQVRAVNSSGTTYANGSSANFWSFTTYHLPGAFNKTSPANGSERESTVTLSWGTSSDAASYEYCYDTTNDNACESWVSTGTNTSVTLSNLDPSATYYWQVRARNAGGFTYADGSNTSFWSFRVNLTRWNGRTNKQSPNEVWFWTNLARTQWLRFRLKYTYVGYCQGIQHERTIEFQFDEPGNITGGQFGDSSASFAFTGRINSPTSASGTFEITNYRLVLPGTNGTCPVYVNDTGTWTTSRSLMRPGVFDKAEPANGATNQNTSLSLWWNDSTDATEYQYCLDTTNNNTCDTNWISTGATLGADLSGLNENTTYYWQVRARNTVGVTDANNGVWWSFTTKGVRQVFVPLVAR